MEENEDQFNDIFSKMAALCSRSEHCSYDVRKKLIQSGIEGPDCEKVIGMLIAEGYLNDQRYVQAYVADKFKFNRWGKLKIRYSLKMKGIPDKLITEGLGEISEDAYRDELIKTMKEKLKGVTKLPKYEAMARIIRFAQSRGFEPELIHRHLSKLKF